MTPASSGSMAQAAFMLCTVPGVKKSQLLSATSTPCLSCGHEKKVRERAETKSTKSLVKAGMTHNL